ncbi:serine/threonine protein kinase [Acidipropionibacterium jensenii]|uniref:serine/threonine-protein kinase n=1 Tax=Acidipropionibacterium jensenii TaxID=1749 RepID=UPI00110B0B69|nr:serine/threonine-protein kinase [Acidipropionibacterium jensenii]QCV89040.1 serine/threonine protein kinase [Acidipropionibacterium jensenii]
MNDDQSEPQGAGRALGSNYLLTSVLGTGSMGEVWRATDRSGRAFAVKLLLPGLASDPDLVRRFVTERSIALGIDSPHVVRVHDMVVEGQTMAIVMDLVDGTDLQSLLARRGTLPAGEAAELGRQIAIGLGAVHAHGIVHRDAKPANVLVEPGPPESARLTDFGVSFLQDASHLSHMTAVVGTPNYMAPEIIEGHRPTAASDLYSLGIMLYEMVCGVTPFATGSTMTVLRGHCQCAPGRPDGFPEPLWQIVSRLLAKSPTDRLYRAADVAAALSAAGPVLAAVPALARLRTPPPAVPLPQLDPTVIPAPDPTWVPGPASPATFPPAAPSAAPASCCCARFPVPRCRSLPGAGRPSTPRGIPTTPSRSGRRRTGRRGHRRLNRRLPVLPARHRNGWDRRCGGRSHRQLGFRDLRSGRRDGTRPVHRSRPAHHFHAIQHADRGRHAEPGQRRHQQLPEPALRLRVHRPDRLVRHRGRRRG